MSASMLDREMMRDRFFRAAAGMTAAAVVLLVAAMVGAVRVQGVEAAPPSVSLPDSALRFPAATPAADLAAAVAHDVFADDRQAPAKRYRLPGEAVAVARQPAARPVVLGTAISLNGESFGTAQLPGGQSTIVRVGSKVGEFVVVSIERGRVAFRAADGERFSVDASKPVP